MENQPIMQPANPKKFPVVAVLISVLITAVIVGGGVYFWQNMQLKTQPQPETYTNSAYGFSITFPVSWGKISAQNIADIGISEARGIRLSSETDPTHRYIQINIVRVEDKNRVVDAPQTFIEENNLWAFYYIGGADCVGMPGCEGQEFEEIFEETKQIIQTFILK